MTGSVTVGNRRDRGRKSIRHACRFGKIAYFWAVEADAAVLHLAEIRLLLLMQRKRVSGICPLGLLVGLGTINGKEGVEFAIDAPNYGET